VQHFRPLLERTAKRFTLKRVSADKAYSAARILAQIESVGAQPLIAFKKNATGASAYKGTVARTFGREPSIFSAIAVKSSWRTTTNRRMPGRPSA
jgi:Transposase DDE domain